MESLLVPSIRPVVMTANVGSETGHVHRRIVESVRARWQAVGHAQLRQLDCEHDSGTLHLRGRLPNFYLKQLAQEVLKHVDGIHRIINSIEVGPASH